MAELIDCSTDVDNIREIDAEGTPKPQSPSLSAAPMNSEPLAQELIVKFHATLPPPRSEAEGQPVLQKMPRYTYVETAAYNQNTFQQVMSENDLMNEQSRNDFIRRLRDTVRWRINADGTRQANAKIRLWSDGSETFHMGAESFDVVRQPLPQRNVQLCSRHGSCYQPQGLFEEKLTFRPKLDSVHVKGLRDRTINKPQTGGLKVIGDATHKACKNVDQLAKQELTRLRQEERKSSASSSVKKRLHPRKAEEDINTDASPERMEDDKEDSADEIIDKADDDASICTSIAAGIAKMKRMFNVDSDSD
ncbi:RNA polymerase-associated protein LEO1 [Drosophila obscura]|uniref:RNA polymerase-associated protein LEO1 n=1 Tax=Drosophila obscura TaxID=7282 RepID=UPI001BB1029E|nr:RNA polymerase-associated protein LEO1 [Drosophila obscura]